MRKLEVINIGRAILAVVLAAVPVFAQRYVAPEVGRKLVERTCVGCHELSVVTSAHKSDPEWEVTLNQMLSNGAKATDDEAEIIYNYLCDNYGTQPAAPAKINVNQASAEQLKSIPELGEPLAKAIVAYREKHGGFKDSADLKKVPHLPAATVDRLQDRLSF